MQKDQTGGTDRAGTPMRTPERGSFRGGRGGGGKGGTGGGSSQTPYSSSPHKQAACWHCQATDHKGHSCPQVRGKGLSTGQVGQLESMGNKKLSLTHGLAHQVAGQRLALHHVGGPGFPHRAEAEATRQSLQADLTLVGEEYSALFERFMADNSRT